MADPNPDDMNSAFSQAVAERQAAQTAANEKAAQAAEKEAQAMERLRRSFGDLAGEVDKAQKSTEAMRRSLADGSYAKANRELSRLRQDEARYRREAALRGQYGDRVGGAMAKYEKPLAMLEATARKSMEMTKNLWSRGMQGTVEQGQRDMELNLLGREIASIFKPVSDVTTDLIRGFRKFLGGLNERGQNALMIGGLGAAGLMAMRGSGLARLALGGLAGGGAMGGIGVGGGAVAGGLLSRVGGGVMSVARKTPIAAMALGAGHEMLSSDGFYERRRARGESKALSAAGALRRPRARRRQRGYQVAWTHQQNVDGVQ